MKIRTQLLPIFVIAVVAGGALLHISQMVQGKEEQLGRLEQRITAEQEAIRVLNAEWAYLNSPTRLEELSAEYLGLAAPDTNQMVLEPKVLPQKPRMVVRPDDIYREISLHEIHGAGESNASHESDVLLERSSVPGRQDGVMTQEFSDIMNQSKVDDQQGVAYDLHQFEPAGGAP
ncbi:MAG: hypothetical protein AAF182_02185 [Pseudomonadota bacterium]